MNHLEARRARVAYAKSIGVVKPSTLKNDALEAAIEAAELIVAAEREAQAVADSDPNRDGEMHDCVHGRMQEHNGTEWVCPAECTDGLSEDVLTDPADVRAAVVANREAWLMAALDAVVPMLEQAGAQNIRNRRVQISVGWPKGSNRWGECWALKHGADQVNHVFISPELEDGLDVLHTIVHEGCHADDDCASKHGGHFKKVMMTCGFDFPKGGRGRTEIGDNARPVLQSILDDLGPYPHVPLTTAERGAKTKQTTRYIKMYCPQADMCSEQSSKKTPFMIRLSREAIRMIEGNAECVRPQCPLDGVDLVHDLTEEQLNGKGEEGAED